MYAHWESWSHTLQTLNVEPNYWTTSLDIFSTILWHAVLNNSVFSLRLENQTSNLHYKCFVSALLLSHTATSLWALISSVSFRWSHMNAVFSPCVREINYLVRLNQPVDALLCYCMNCICMYDDLLWRLHFPISLHLSVITGISSSVPSREEEDIAVWLSQGVRHCMIPNGMFSAVLWFFLVYPFGKEPVEGVLKGRTGGTRGTMCLRIHSDYASYWCKGRH